MQYVLRDGRLVLRSRRRRSTRDRDAALRKIPSHAQTQKRLGGGITRLRDVSGHPDLSSIFLALALSALGRTRFKTPSFSVASMRSRSSFSAGWNTLRNPP